MTNSEQNVSVTQMKPKQNQGGGGGPKPGTPAYFRMARRKAVRMGLNPSSGEEAARMLEERGFDVTRDRVTMLDTTAAGQNPMPGGAGAGGKGPAEAPDFISPEQREADIRKIQRAIARRRQLRFFLIALRLLVFVVFPTWLVGYYFFNIATPMYEVESQMVIQKPGGSIDASGAGGLLGGGGLSNFEDSVIVQGYLGSREAMLRLDAENGFIAHFQQDFIDDIQRMPPDVTMEAAYEMYQKYVKIGYDPTEGVIRMSVIALTPEKATEFSRALIAFAEERVDQIAAPVRRDQLAVAEANYAKAEQAVRDAANHVLELQQSAGVISPDADATGQMTIVNNLEAQLDQRRLALAEINRNEAPNQAQVRAIEDEIKSLTERIAERRAAMFSSNDASASLARISGELSIARSNLEMRQLLLQQSLSALENARVETNRQTRYLSLAVAPVPPDEPTHPRAVENTVLALALFFGIYIFLSLTVAILREQIGS